MVRQPTVHGRAAVRVKEERPAFVREDETALHEVGVRVRRTAESLCRSQLEAHVQRRQPFRELGARFPGGVQLGPGDELDRPGSRSHLSHEHDVLLVAGAMPKLEAAVGERTLRFEFDGTLVAPRLAGESGHVREGRGDKMQVPVALVRLLPVPQLGRTGGLPFGCRGGRCQGQRRDVRSDGNAGDRHERDACQVRHCRAPVGEGRQRVRPPIPVFPAHPDGDLALGVLQDCREYHAIRTGRGDRRFAYPQRAPLFRGR